ncbi:Transposable element Tcb1 transposase, partial [Stegodyphus mimosarum]
MLGSRTDLHISQGGSSPGTAIVTRFFFLTCVFSQGLWVLSSSSWTTTLHLIAQLLSKSCWRVKILNTWIGRQATGRQVSRFTVVRRLHKGGLFARRPERCLPLKVRHGRHSLQWCREHKNWTPDQCSRVLFTDESRFSTRSDSQRALIWREVETRFYPSNIKERHRNGGPGVPVWGGIMLNGRTELHVFDRGSVTGDRYCEEVLLPHVRLFRGAIGPDLIFMDDNARPHQTLAVEELLESEDITRMDWPAYSADLIPIEHVWNALGRRIAACLHPPEDTQQLKQMLIEEWARLPQEILHQLVLSMRRRCEATIEVGEGHIPY